VKIVFLHGLESSPNSAKVKFLREQGHEVLAPRLDRNDWEQSVMAARDAITAFQPDVVVGSSRGGAVAMVARVSPIPTILIAPAWKKYAPWATISGSTVILHSSQDWIVPFADSEELARTFGAKLYDVGEDHRMNDPEALSALAVGLDWQGHGWFSKNLQDNT